MAFRYQSLLRSDWLRALLLQLVRAAVLVAFAVLGAFLLVNAPPLVWLPYFAVAMMVGQLVRGLVARKLEAQ